VLSARSENTRYQIVALAAQHRIPAIYYLREFAEVGGLMAYGNRVAPTSSPCTSILRRRCCRWRKVARAALFPLKIWRRLLQSNLSHGGSIGLSHYGDPAGLPAPLSLERRQIRPGRRQSGYLDRLRIGHLLECLRRGDPDARRGDILRCPVQQQGSISRLRHDRLGQYAEYAGQDHSQVGCAALLSALDPGAEGSGRVIQQGCVRTGQDGVQRFGEVRDLSRAAALHRAGVQHACAQRDRRRRVPD